MPQPNTHQLAQLYRDTLVNDVAPFWMRHGLDPEHGAILNCLDDSGSVISRDRYLWSQGRALWTFSALYNRIEPRQEWLDVAHGIAGYLKTHGRDSEGRWMYRLSEDGAVLDRDLSIYVDGFVINGLSEYCVVTGDPEAADLALATYACADDRIRRPGSYGIAPYVLAEGVKTLGIPMIFSFFFYNLAKALDRPDIRSRALDLANEVFDFYMPDKDTGLEFVRIDGGMVGTPEGRVCIPGHIIEAMWFLISIFEETGDTEAIQRCCRMIKRHIELGWDPEYGGMRLALDVEGHEPPKWKNPYCKPWWVQVESLIATAYAHLHTGESWCMEWHNRIREYAFAHYPAPKGEWTQWLDRYGAKAESAALPVKDPFHLPRGLIYLIDLFGRCPREGEAPADP
jgi:N-acylglucosamine 2-epimerase